MSDGWFSPEWVSAAAAVVQAVGSVAAIVYAVRIAREADRRAGAAERQADQRALAAERTAEARSGSERDQRERQVVDAAVAIGMRVLEDCRAQAATFGASQGAVTFMGGIQLRDSALVERMAPQISARSSRPDIMLAIEDLRRDCQPDPNRPISGSGPEMAAHLNAFAAEVERHLEALRTLRP